MDRQETARRYVAHGLDEAVRELDDALELLPETGLPEDVRTELEATITNAKQAAQAALDAAAEHLPVTTT